MIAKTDIKYWLVLAALLALAITLRLVVAANIDVSWLLTVGERVLGGERLYVDVIETNPPMAVLAYMPAIVIAHVTSLRAEIITHCLVFLGTALSLGVSAKILRTSRALAHVRGWWLLIIAFAALAILPTQTFGQREHIALIALLPALALFAMRAHGDTPQRWAIIVAGLGMGLTLTFKPHFAIAVACGVGALAIYLRTWRIIFAPENAIAAALVAIYVLCIFLFAPEFLTIVAPLVRDVYMPVGISWTALASKEAVPIYLGLIATAIFLTQQREFDAPFILTLATSAGFAIVFFIQRKGFAYHSYPMIALAALTLGYAIASNPLQNKRDRAFNACAIALLALLGAGAMLWFNNSFDANPLQAPVEKVDSYPTILALTAEPGIGHPLVRALNGTWVSRQQALWVTAYADRIRREGALDPARDDLLKNYEARERAMLIDDIQKHPPTVVLIDNLTGEWSAWLRAHPDVADMLKPYERVETLNKVEIFKRTN